MVTGLIWGLSMSSSVSFLVHWSNVFLQKNWQIKAAVEHVVLRPCTVPWLLLGGVRVLLARILQLQRDLNSMCYARGSKALQGY